MLIMSKKKAGDVKGGFCRASQRIYYRSKGFLFLNPAENQCQADVKLSISFIRRALSVNPPRIYQAATKVIGKVGLYLKPVVDR